MFVSFALSRSPQSHDAFSFAVSGLFFNKAADSCDYARNVICNKKQAAAPSTTSAPSTTAASSGRHTTSTTTTTTTTTEAPFEEEEEEEVEDEDAGQEDPESLKELLNLIKKLGRCPSNHVLI